MGINFHNKEVMHFIFMQNTYTRRTIVHNFDEYVQIFR